MNSSTMAKSGARSVRKDSLKPCGGDPVIWNPGLRPAIWHPKIVLALKTGGLLPQISTTAKCPRLKGNSYYWMRDVTSKRRNASQETVSCLFYSTCWAAVCRDLQHWKWLKLFAKSRSLVSRKSSFKRCWNASICSSTAEILLCFFLIKRKMNPKKYSEHGVKIKIKIKINLSWNTVNFLHLACSSRLRCSRVTGHFCWRFSPGNDGAGMAPGVDFVDRIALMASGDSSTRNEASNP